MSYTPSTEQVRSFWASDGAHQPAAKSYDHIESAEEFDRWLASVKAELLREAAEAITPPYGCELYPDGSSDPAAEAYVEASQEVWQILHNRADQIENGEDA